MSESNATLNDFETRASAYVGMLRQLRSRRSDDPSARRDLAVLRYGLRGTADDQYRMMRVVGPFLKDRPTDEDDLFFLIGSLFALFPDEVKNRGLGAALGLLRDDGNGAETRLMNILPRRRSQLGHPLRSIVALLSSIRSADGTQGVAFDYRRLMRDLNRWDWENKATQNEWAKEFYRAPTHGLLHEAAHHFERDDRTS